MASKISEAIPKEIKVQVGDKTQPTHICVMLFS